MLLGFVCAVGHGAALPLLMLYFGDLTNSFIFHEISSDIAQNVSSQAGIGDIDCDTVFNYTFGDTTVQDTTITMILQSIPDAGFEDAECLLGGDFISSVNTSVFAFIGIALAVVVVATLQIATFQIAAERQVYKIRVLYYRAILRQDIAWFDENPTGELVNRLSE
jgi:ABC-type multidrug transport system fused ATPase/permease subunit